MNASNLWNREPALVVGFVQAILSLGLAFGLSLTPEQMSGILVLAAAALSLVVRRKVSPVVVVPTEPDPEIPANVELGEE